MHHPGLWQEALRGIICPPGRRGILGARGHATQSSRGLPIKGLLSATALSPTFEVQPQSGGRWPRTFEPWRHRPFCPGPWEFESGLCLRVPVPGAPTRFRNKGQYLTSQTGLREGVPDHRCRPSGPSCTGEPLGGWWFPVLSASCVWEPVGPGWRSPVGSHTPRCRGWLGALEGPLCCPLHPQLIPSSGHGRS